MSQAIGNEKGITRRQDDLMIFWRQSFSCPRSGQTRPSSLCKGIYQCLPDVIHVEFQPYFLRRKIGRITIMKAEILVHKNQSVYRIERGRAAAEVRFAPRPRLRINFAGGALDVSLTIEEAYRLGVALIASAEMQVQERKNSAKRM